MEDVDEMRALIERHSGLLLKRLEVANALGLELQAITEEINAIGEGIDARVAALKAREQSLSPPAGARPLPPRTGTGVQMPKGPMR